MGISYKPLRLTLAKFGINKTKLRVEAKLSTVTLAKLGKGEPVSISIIERICLTLEVPITDVVEITQDESNEGL